MAIGEYVMKVRTAVADFIAPRRGMVVCITVNTDVTPEEVAKAVAHRLSQLRSEDIPDDVA